MKLEISKSDNFYKSIPVLAETGGGADRWAIFAKPCEVVKSCLILKRGSKDREGMLDAFLRLCSSLSSCAYSSVALIDLALSAATILRLVIKQPITKTARLLPPLGLAASCLDACFDLVKLRRNRLFLSHFTDTPLPNKNLNWEELEKIAANHAVDIPKNMNLQEATQLVLESLACSSALQKLLYLRNTYLSVPKEEQRDLTPLLIKALQNTPSGVRISKLARRVQPWCQERISNELPTILENIRSNNPEKRAKGLKEAEDLIETIKIQGKKTQIIHVISLVALAISSLGFIALLAAFPYVVFLVLLIVGGMASFGIGTYSSITLPCEKWNYDTRELLPNWALNFFEIGRARDQIILREVLLNNIEHLEEIRNPYEKARAYFLAIQEELIKDEEKVVEAQDKLKKLSIYYFNRAQEVLEERALEKKPS